MPWSNPFRRSRQAPWWRHFPRTESRTYRPQPPDAKPALEVGIFVLLTGKPDRPRRVLSSEWHGHRYEFVYVVETSAPNNFKPYWFIAQLAVVADGEA